MKPVDLTIPLTLASGGIMVVPEARREEISAGAGQEGWESRSRPSARN
jgi:hypothetical protein